jgi:hypothetical protein
VSKVNPFLMACRYIMTKLWALCVLSLNYPICDMLSVAAWLHRS